MSYYLLYASPTYINLMFTQDGIIYMLVSNLMIGIVWMEESVHGIR